MRSASKTWLALCGGLAAVTADLRPDTSRVAATITKIVKLGPTHAATGDKLNLGHARAVHWKHALDTDAVGDFSNRKGAVVSTPATVDANTFEDLDTLFVALGDERVHADAIPSAKLGMVAAGLAGFNGFNDWGTVAHDGLDSSGLEILGPAFEEVLQLAGDTSGGGFTWLGLRRVDHSSPVFNPRIAVELRDRPVAEVEEEI
jgi:hypothetical protein